MTKKEVTLRKPAFLSGGRIIPGDLTPRSADGYPLDEAGNIDKEATKREVNAYYTRLHTLQGSKKASNYTPSKKKRK